MLWFYSRYPEGKWMRMVWGHYFVRRAPQLSEFRLSLFQKSQRME